MQHFHHHLEQRDDKGQHFEFQVTWLPSTTVLSMEPKIHYAMTMVAITSRAAISKDQ
jgi:hypothetical protein